MRILVIGGAGYIGSHMSIMLHDAGHEVVVFDNLSTGRRDAVICAGFIQGDLSNKSEINAVLSTEEFDAVMHFSSSSIVSESVKDPSKYYRNNFSNTQNLIDSMLANGVRHLVFSSSAAIFGEPKYVPIDENHPKMPVNPYGRSKLMVEDMLADYDDAYGLKSVCFRYFNAAGADPLCRTGESHEPETHLIPLALQAASGRSNGLFVYGRDYSTLDGTCIRDYIHVMDLCKAHLLGLHWLNDRRESRAFNLGSGHGFSVRQVIEIAERVTGKTIPVTYRPRRHGDPAILVSDSSLAKLELGWSPEFMGMETMIAHAWQWECKRSRFYEPLRI